ncbi:hypothetical protein ACIBJI_39970 [Nocardia sp. NPDC050408]|uniref:hypothetical protein n=1 Tax=Nocardia sp. NPDC050408 TaxID=3364319 RepID=UPI00379F7BD7
MRVDPPSTIENSPFPSAPDPKGPVHPLVALSLAVSLASAAGLLDGWDASVTVLSCVLSFFAANPPGRSQ